MTKSTGYRAAFSPSPKKKNTASPTKRASRESLVSESPAHSAAAQALEAYLKEKYACGQFAGTDVAQLGHLLVACGLPFQHLALDPDASGFKSNANRKIRQTWRIDLIEARMLEIEIPMCVADELRDMHPHPFRPIADILRSLFLEAPEDFIEHAKNLQIPNWIESSVRASCSADELVIPFGMFIDAAAWRGKGAGTRDSIVSYMINLHGGSKRQCITTVRKDELCGDAVACSCRGRESLMAIDKAVAWLAAWAAQGVTPSVDWRGRPWHGPPGSKPGTTTFSYRGKRVRFACIELRSDLDQYASGMGFAKTNQAWPCMFCKCRKNELHQRSQKLIGSPRPHSISLLRNRSARPPQVPGCAGADDSRRSRS